MTAQAIFNIAMDLMANRLESGTIDPTGTAEYAVRAPGILTELQCEICREAPIYKTVTITSSGTDKEYVKLTLPSDFISIHQILDSDLNPIDDFRRVGNDIYVLDTLTGTLVYKYTPTAISSLTATMDFNNQICSTILPNGLASKLLATENASLSNYFGQVYEELKRDISKKEPSPAIKIKDYYDTKLTY